LKLRELVTPPRKGWFLQTLFRPLPPKSGGHNTVNSASATNTVNIATNTNTSTVNIATATNTSTTVHYERLLWI